MDSVSATGYGASTMNGEPTISHAGLSQPLAPLQVATT